MEDQDVTGSDREPDQEPDPDWDGLEDQLVDRVTGLADRGRVTVTVDSARVEPLTVRPARFFGMIPPKKVRTLPTLELVRLEEHLRIECTGAANRGGPIPLPADALGTMTTLGWHPGGGADGTRWTRFWPDDVATGPYPAPGAPRAAARLAVSTLREVFACPGPDVASLSEDELPHPPGTGAGTPSNPG